ncbi:hypothetical protein ACFP3I_05125 [Chryseobacterium arachidis]
MHEDYLLKHNLTAILNMKSMSGPYFSTRRDYLRKNFITKLKYDEN